VASGNQHVCQAHNSAWTGRVWVEDTVTASGQIHVDLIERFRMVYTSSLEEAIGFRQR
jgi:hypothetical protein